VRVAIVGGGVSGLVAAHRLHRRHAITLFEANAHLGGHTHTVRVTGGGSDGEWAVDTGFIVFNDRNYPHFTRLLTELGVASQPTRMSFSVRDEGRDFEYNGSSLNRLFGQRRNLLRPSFYRMAADIIRFSRTAPDAVRNGAAQATLDEYVSHAGYSPSFRDEYLVPMAAALWSQPRRQVLAMPLAFLVEFLEHHGMLSLGARPTWRVVCGGSARYVEALVAPWRGCVRLRSPVRHVVRHPDRVEVDGAPFDAVVFACHADQALGLLGDATPPEREILGALAFQANDVVLHTDTRLLPRRRALWAAWNYHLAPDPERPAAVTYDMNILQSLDAPETYCVTLNRTGDIAPDRILERFTYHHPVITTASVRAQARHAEISGRRRTYYCGAYWGNGFHEAGVASAVAVARTVDGDA
jgi:predicted NAD/FAD-binding protein